MKIGIGILLASSLMFASNEFKQNVEYTCLNTAIVENGKKQEVLFSKSLDMPFIFTIKGKELKTVNNITFDYKMEKDDLISYSNDTFMLLLMKNNELGLVPKEAKGQVQYLFKCRSK